jgi:hypothetical protein
MRRGMKFGILLLVMAVFAIAEDKPTEHFAAMAVLPPGPGSSTLPLNIDVQAYTGDSTMNELSAILSDGNNQDALLKKFNSMPGIGDVSREGRAGVQVKVIRVRQTAQGLREITCSQIGRYTSGNSVMVRRRSIIRTG